MSVTLAGAAWGCGGSGGGEADDGGGGGDAAPCSTAADCDDGRFCNGEEQCAPGDPAADARGCVMGTAPECAGGATCDEDSDSCEIACEGAADSDGDDHDAIACGGDDCDDEDSTRFPGNTEVCDSEDHDEDCDPTTFGFRDQDMDGVPDAMCCNEAQDGTRSCGTDCDDLNAMVNPRTSEVCDTIDNDCDTETDEGVLMDFFRDEDEDGFGVDGDTTSGCSAASPYTATVGGDCDDDDVAAFPGASETCNMADDDCDEMVDEGTLEVFYLDADGDGHGDPAEEMMTCEAPDGYVSSDDDCDDGDPDVFTGAAEICDGKDSDCADGGGAEPLEDGDGDGHAPADAPCTVIPGRMQKDDCRDDIPEVHPPDGPYTFQEDGACAIGRTACYTLNIILDSRGMVEESETRWMCIDDSVTCPTDGAPIFGNQPRPTWDYDCDGVETPLPQADSSCGGGGVCGECGDSGPVTDYSGMDPPPCGSEVDYRNCFCMFSGCNGEVITRTLACF